LDLVITVLLLDCGWSHAMVGARALRSACCAGWWDSKCHWR